MSRIAAVIIFYNPTESMIKNINSYIRDINKLFIIDNSSNDNSHFLSIIESDSEIQYLPQFSNLGIAKALNIAASIAVKENYKYLLTMDQDSKFEPEGIPLLLNTILPNSNVGIIAPRCVFDPDRKIYPEKNILDVDVVPTSGNILSLDAWSVVGGFTEKLFIDMVDFDYCLKLRKFGYRILVNHSVLLYHKLGNMRRHHFLFWKMYATHHSSIRLFYRTRNRFYLKENFRSDFPLVIKKEYSEFFKEFLKMLLYEDHKWKKIRMIISGYKAYRIDSYGKYEEK